MPHFELKFPLMQHNCLNDESRDLNAFVLKMRICLHWQPSLIFYSKEFSSYQSVLSATSVSPTNSAWINFRFSTSRPSSSFVGSERVFNGNMRKNTVTSMLVSSSSPRQYFTKFTSSSTIEM